MLDGDIKGIQLIHIPKCGGTYAKDHLQALAKKLKIGWDYNSHRYFHEGVYGPPQDYLSIAIVRNPFDLLVSLWHWDEHKDKGYGNIRERFSSFENFVLYFCLISDFAFAPRGDWFFSIEPFHFSADIDGTPRDRYFEMNNVKPWMLTKLELALMCRPKPWVSNKGQIVNAGLPHAAEFLISSDESISASFVDSGSNVLDRRAMFDGDENVAPAWKPWPHTQEDASTNYAWANMCGSKGLQMNMLHDAWLYTSFMWYSLFNWESGNMVPHLIIPIEIFDETFSMLTDSFGVSNLKVENARKNEGISRKKKQYHDYYTPDLASLVSNLLCPELRLFGYRFSQEDSPALKVLSKSDYNNSSRPWLNFQSNLGANKWLL